MDKAGQIGIELKMLMDSAKSQVAEFCKYSATMLGKSGLGPGGVGGGGATAKPPAGIEAIGESAKKSTAALKDLQKASLEAWRAANAGGVAPGQKIQTAPGNTPPGYWSQYGPSMNPTGGPAPGGTGNAYNAWKAQQQQGGVGASTTTSWAALMARSTPPVIPQQPATTLASMIGNFFNRNLTGPQSMMVGVTAAFAALRVAIGLASWAFRTLTAPVRMLVNMFFDAAEQAKRLYSHSLQSGGLPLGFVARQQALASILGVGENDVWQYGKAIASLNGKIKEATSSIARATPVLTAVSWEWSVVKLNMEAAKMSIMENLAPAMNVLIQGLRGVSVAMLYVSKHIDFARLAAEHFFGGVWGRAIAAAMHMAVPSAPNPLASAHRYQTSSMERMGLVLGLGGSSPVAQTARNTATTVTVLRNIERNMKRPGESYFKQSGAAMA